MMRGRMTEDVFEKNDICKINNMSGAPAFIIPIESEIAQFAQHLRMHSRTILSAKFGDGKSFFLDGVEKDKDVAAEYKFILSVLVVMLLRWPVWLPPH